MLGVLLGVLLDPVPMAMLAAGTTATKATSAARMVFTGM
jgi:hypothetical protein